MTRTIPIVLDKLSTRCGPKRIPMHERFWAKVQKSEDGCWLWTGKLSRTGYGYISLPGRHNGSVGAHRYSAMLHYGMFDNRLMSLHRCDIPACVRPDHLYIGTCADNMRDRDTRRRNSNMRKTYCVNGHEFDEKNTYLRLRSEGGRMCRKCTAVRVSDLRANRKVKKNG